MKKWMIGACVMLMSAVAFAKPTGNMERSADKVSIDTTRVQPVAKAKFPSAPQKQEYPKDTTSYAPKMANDTVLAVQSPKPEYPQYPEYPEYPEYPTAPEYPATPEYPNTPKQDTTRVKQDKKAGVKPSSVAKPGQKTEYPQAPKKDVKAAEPAPLENATLNTLIEQEVSRRENEKSSK